MPRTPHTEVRNITVPAISQRAGEDGFTMRRTTVGSGRNQVITWERKRDIEIYVGGTPGEFISELQKVSKGLTDARVELDTYYLAYDDNEYKRFLLTGYTVATDAEVARAIKHITEEDEKRTAREREHAERSLAQIRRQFPELL